MFALELHLKNETILILVIVLSVFAGEVYPTDFSIFDRDGSIQPY